MLRRWATTMSASRRKQIDFRRHEHQAACAWASGVTRKANRMRREAPSSCSSPLGESREELRGLGVRGDAETSPGPPYT